MNSSISANHSNVYACTATYPGSALAKASGLGDFFFLPLHCWILWLVTRGIKAGGSIAPSDILTMNIAVAEITSCFSFALLVCGALFYSQHIMFFGIFFSGAHLVGRPLLNSVICVERCLAVVYPVSLRHSSSRQRYGVVGAVWLLTLGFGAISIITFPVFPSTLFVSLLMIDLIVITSCSLAMLKALVRSGPTDRENKEMQQKKRRVFMVIIAILVVLIIAYGPFVVAFLIKENLSTSSFCLTIGISLWFLKPSSIIQPLLYLFKLRKLVCQSYLNSNLEN